MSDSPTQGRGEIAELEWAAARAELSMSRRHLATAPPGDARQMHFDRTLAAGRHCTEVAHEWLARSFELDRVDEPRMLLSLDVDGVLEDWSDGFTATSICGAAALRLLQLGGVAVVLNTAHSLHAVAQRARQFHLQGGVAAFGGTSIDVLFDRVERLVSRPGERQLARLRGALRADPSVVLDREHDCSVRASRIVEGTLRPITGADARQLLDELSIYELTFWVAPHYTDFVDRSIDKGMGMNRLRQSFGLSSLPLAAMGDGSCDVPILKRAQRAFIPGATLPAYTPPKGQRLFRSRFLGAQALWEAATQLVPNVTLQRRVIDQAHDLDIPGWFPEPLRQLPPTTPRLFPKLAAAFARL